jgi:hypothetical protein
VLISSSSFNTGAIYSEGANIFLKRCRFYSDEGTDMNDVYVNSGQSFFYILFLLV